MRRQHRDRLRAPLPTLFRAAATAATATTTLVMIRNNNGAMGRKRAPEGAGGMQQCQNHWQAWHILQCAQSRRSGRKEEKFREKSGKLRCRCGFARTQAFKHAWRSIFCRARSFFQHDCLDMFTKRSTETQPHRHTETRAQVVFVTASARHCPCPGCKSLLGHGPALNRTY